QNKVSQPRESGSANALLYIAPESCVQQAQQDMPSKWQFTYSLDAALLVEIPQVNRGLMMRHSEMNCRWRLTRRPVFSTNCSNHSAGETSRTHFRCWISKTRKFTTQT